MGRIYNRIDFYVISEKGLAILTCQASKIISGLTRLATKTVLNISLLIWDHRIKNTPGGGEI